MQVVIIISQIKVNCMTVVRLKSIDAHGLSDQFGEFPSSAYLTSNVEQVDVLLRIACFFFSLVLCLLVNIMTNPTIIV